MQSGVNCVISIPIYKEFIALNEWEVASLKQAFKIFGSRNICLFGPWCLNYTPYLDLAKVYNTSLSVINFENSYFDGVRGYNELMLSEVFYSRFKDYSYLLIYQLDCWAFRDDLEYWCSKGYDYIGAPWSDDRNLEKVINNRRKPFFKVSIFLQRLIGKRKDWRVGNGGLSLRKINTFLSVLSKFKNNPKVFQANEDLFWGIYIPLIYPSFKVPNEKIALGFAFEMNPKVCYQMNDFQLPFGCHAWHKYDYTFWQQWIKI